MSANNGKYDKGGLSMNRRVLLAICAICVLLAVACGTISCTGGESTGIPATYSKLIGVGTVGPVGGNESYDTECLFVFTNPDSVGNITILSLRLFDVYGNKVYDGAATNMTGWASLPHDMSPHQVAGVPLWSSMGYGTGPFTLELGWRGKSGICPLSGYVGQYVYRVEGNSTTLISYATNTMVSVAQVLKP
jgi:hypothetical protein